MKVAELDRILKEKGYDEHVYSLTLKKLPFQGYVLEHAGEKAWVVYFSERGFSNEIARFVHEWDACDYMLYKLLTDYKSYGTWSDSGHNH